MEKDVRRIKYLFMAIVAGLGLIRIPANSVIAAENCPEVKIVFARGSGGERWNDQNYLAFKNGVEEKLKTTGLSYDFLDLDYPAIDIGNFWVLMGAYFGGGEAYAFGDSVNAGVLELVRVVNNECPDTKYVVGGYSQGAMVVSKALHYLNAEKVIYAATFGDPKIYLPEGFGLYPDACRNVNLSEYRAYVPDCFAYMGMLGSYLPYQPTGFSGKLGTWCNTHDFFCSSHLSISSHTSYVADDLYKEASEVIFRKIAAEFGIEIKVRPTEDVAILIMDDRDFNEAWSPVGAARDFALEALKSDKRVAVYYYNTGLGRHNFRRLCNFEECDSEGKVLTATSALLGGQSLMTGAGDVTLTAIQRIFETESWDEKAEKSLMIFSNHLFFEPDSKGTTVSEVIANGTDLGIKLSASVEPSQYESEDAEILLAAYTALTEGLGGGIALVGSEPMMLALEEVDLATNEALPTLEILDVEEIEEDTVKIKLKNSGTKIAVALNDGFLGMTRENEIIIGELDRTKENIILISALSETRRGEQKEIKIDMKMPFVPKAPKTGVK